MVNQPEDGNTKLKGVIPFNGGRQLYTFKMDQRPALCGAYFALSEVSEMEYMMVSFQ